MAGGERGAVTPGDPEIRAFNQLLLGQIRPALRTAGGLPGLTAFRPGAIPGAQELGILGQIGARGTMPFAEKFRGFFDPLLSAAKGTFEGQIAPGIVNRLTSLGFGPGSGAVAEALARGGAEFSTPFAQLAGQFAATDPVMAQLQGALSAVGAPRVAQLQEESTLRDLLLSLFGRPLAPSGAGNIVGLTRPDYLGALLGSGGAGASIGPVISAIGALL